MLRKFVLSFFVFMIFLQSDTIILNNGAKIKGVIAAEDSLFIKVNKGFGFVKFRKETIKNILRDEEHNKQLQTLWKKKYYTKYLPKKYKKMYSLMDYLKNLEDKIQKAKDGGSLNIYGMPKDPYEDQRRRLIKKYNMIVDSISDIRENYSKSKFISYEQTDDFMGMRRRVRILEKKIKNLEANYFKHASRTLEKKNTLEDLTVEYQDKIKELEDMYDNCDFKDLSKEQVAKFKKECSRYIGLSKGVEIPVDKDGHYYAQTTINGKKIRLMIDTGASLVIIPLSFAKKIRVFNQKGKKCNLLMANGVLCEVYIAILPEVRIGNICKKNVKAAIIPDGVSNQVQGVLGMSFLGGYNFAVINGNKLVIR